MPFAARFVICCRDAMLLTLCMWLGSVFEGTAFVVGVEEVRPGVVVRHCGDPADGRVGVPVEPLGVSFVGFVAAARRLNVGLWYVGGLEMY